jgi:hypothetical protein
MAYVIFSASELVKHYKDWHTGLLETQRADVNTLFRNLGGDTSRGIEVQEGLQHRNKFNEVVTCDRYVMLERTDKAWITSEWCSFDNKMENSDPEVVKDIVKMKRGKVDRVVQNKEEI